VTFALWAGPDLHGNSSSQQFAVLCGRTLVCRACAGCASGKHSPCGSQYDIRPIRMSGECSAHSFLACSRLHMIVFCQLCENSCVFLIPILNDLPRNFSLLPQVCSCCAEVTPGLSLCDALLPLMGDPSATTLQKDTQCAKI
jgi:hypothetical protein